MLHDFFTLFSDRQSRCVLQVTLSLDSHEEIIYAKLFPPSASIPSACSEKILSYLAEGFDSIDQWGGDDIGLHMNIRHMGFNPLISLSTLGAGFLYDNSAFLAPLFKLLQRNASDLNSVSLPCTAGSLAAALSSAGVISPSPAHPDALLRIPMRLVLSREYSRIKHELSPYL